MGIKITFVLGVAARAAAVVVSLTWGTWASAAEFYWLDPSGSAVGAANGGVAVGYAGEAFRWSRSSPYQYDYLGSDGTVANHAHGVSSDGSVVVGQVDTPDGPQAFRWTDVEGKVVLGELPGGLSHSDALAVSGDGAVVVGTSEGPNGSEAFRWTKSGGLVGLGPDTVQATGASYDGSAVAGSGGFAGSAQAFRWTAGTGVVPLGDLPGGSNYSRGWAISADGNVVVGQASVTDGRHAFRWSQAEGMTSLGDLPGGHVNANALGTNADGSVVVGGGLTANGGEAFIWDSVDGMRNLQDVLTAEYGLTVPGLLREATSVSPDGTVVVGWGVNSGIGRPWVAIIPEPSCPLLVAVGGLSLLRRRRRA